MGLYLINIFRSSRSRSQSTGGLSIWCEGYHERRADEYPLRDSISSATILFYLVALPRKSALDLPTVLRLNESNTQFGIYDESLTSIYRLLDKRCLRQGLPQHHMACETPIPKVHGSEFSSMVLESIGRICLCIKRAQRRQNDCNSSTNWNTVSKSQNWLKLWRLRADVIAISITTSGNTNFWTYGKWKKGKKDNETCSISKSCTNPPSRSRWILRRTFIIIYGMREVRWDLLYELNIRYMTLRKAVFEVTTISFWSSRKPGWTKG